MPVACPKKPLAKNCQKEPAVDVKAKGLWPPKGGTQYKVQTGDNWVKLAEKWNVTPRQLIGFNFNTDSPREVNWYLDKYVGCVERTADCCNWRFTSDATPGIIYKPWNGYPRPHGDPTVPVPPASDPDPIKDEPLNIPKSSTHFSIRMLGAAAVPMPKIALAIDSLYFEIKNLTSRKTAIYRYTGVGLGKGIYSSSATLAGDPVTFRTSGPIFETDFAGFTRFTTAGGGSISVNILDMWGTPPGIDNVYLEVSSGFTFGLGASFTIGQMILMWGGN